MTIDVNKINNARKVAGTINNMVNLARQNLQQLDQQGKISVDVGYQAFVDILGADGAAFAQAAHAGAVTAATQLLQALSEPVPAVTAFVAAS